MSPAWTSSGLRLQFGDSAVAGHSQTPLPSLDPGEMRLGLLITGTDFVAEAGSRRRELCNLEVKASFHECHT